MLNFRACISFLLTNKQTDRQTNEQTNKQTSIIIALHGKVPWIRTVKQFLVENPWNCFPCSGCETCQAFLPPEQ